MDFDAFIFKILRCIRHNKKHGISIHEIEKKYGPHANAFLIQLLMNDEYVVVMRTPYSPLLPEQHEEVLKHPEYKVYCTHKGLALLEQRFFDFWKWVIPTLISIAALIVSVIAAIR